MGAVPQQDAKRLSLGNRSSDPTRPMMRAARTGPTPGNCSNAVAASYTAPDTCRSAAATFLPRWQISETR